MIPEFETETGCLPPGEHSATWREILERFGWNAHRRRLLSGLLRIASGLRDAGCATILLDGSFVTDKERPSDFDACADYRGVPAVKLMRLRLMAGRDVMKAEYRGEIHHQDDAADDRYTYRQFFQRDGDDVPKGIVALALESIP